MMTLRWFFVGLVVVLLAACTAVSSEESLAEVVTSQPTREVATSTRRATETAVSTATPTIDPTAIPAVLPSRTAIPELDNEHGNPIPLPIQVTGQYKLQRQRVSCLLDVIQAETDSVNIELDCNNRMPSPRMGHFVQMLPLENNTAVFHTNQYAAECQISFVFQGLRVETTQTGSWVDCGFGGDLDVSGTYTRTEDDPVLTCQPPDCEPTSYAFPVVEILHTSESPVDSWTAVSERGYFDGNLREVQRLRVTHTQNGTEWIVGTVQLIDFGSFFKTPMPLHWSQNGRYLYFTHTGYGDGCSRPSNVNGMQRLDLATGEVALIFRDGYWYSFSPDEQKLAYLTDKRGLVIQNLIDGSEHAIKLEIETGPDYVFLSNLMWSGDSHSLLMIAYLRPCDTPDVRRDGIVYVDSKALTQLTQILEIQEIQGVKEWAQWNMVLLSLSGEPELGWLNLETGELTAVSP